MKGYQQRIAELAPDLNPRFVEGLMRLEHGTLDGLSVAQFKEEIVIARACIAEASTEELEKLARSYGL